MKILVIGGSKGLGREVVVAGLAAGHQVAAFSRSGGPAIKHDRLRKVSGDVQNADQVGQAVKGQDAVVITLGLPTRLAIGPPIARRVDLLSRGTANVIEAMKRHGTRRLVTETAIGSGDSRKDCTLIARLAFRLGLRWLFKEKDRQEGLTERSGLDWTIIRPSALSNGPATGHFQRLEHERIGLLTHISRKDVAGAILDILADKTTVGKKYILTYPPRFGDSIRWLRHYR